jgi:hypothetical protein
MRDRAASGDAGRLTWLEWSGDPDGDLEDEAAWAQANPAVASGRLSVERMREERAALGPARFAAERLAAAPWPSEQADSWQLFSEQDWQEATR